MTRGIHKHLAAAALLGLALIMTGCALTSGQVTYQAPKPGPVVATGAKAVMPLVADKRSWPSQAAAKPGNNIRIFAPQITQELRAGLVKAGLFAALPAPDQGAAQGLGSRLEVTVTRFNMEKLGVNAYIVPHLLVDGVALPAFAALAIVSGGDLDLGGYLVPSAKMGITLQVSATYREDGSPVLTRSYLVSIPLDAVSQRELRKGGAANYGVKLGKEKGALALAALTQAMARDPHWAVLDRYRRLAQAEKIITGQADFQDKLHAARGLLGLFEPLRFSPEVASVLLDSVLTAQNRAGIVNDLIARQLGLSGPNMLPKDRLMTADKAGKLFDDPAVPRSQVDAAVSQRALDAILMVVGPPAPPAKGEKKAMQAMPPDAARQRAQLGMDLARALKDKPNQQAILLKRAERAVQEQWPPMQAILKAIGSAQTRGYLQTRGG